jgi:hypothetical protein
VTVIAHDSATTSLTIVRTGRIRRLQKRSIIESMGTEEKKDLLRIIVIMNTVDSKINGVMKFQRNMNFIMGMEYESNSLTFRNHPQQQLRLYVK